MTEFIYIVLLLGFCIVALFCFVLRQAFSSFKFTILLTKSFKCKDYELSLVSFVCYFVLFCLSCFLTEAFYMFSFITTKDNLGI